MGLDLFSLPGPGYTVTEADPGSPGCCVSPRTSNKVVCVAVCTEGGDGMAHGGRVSSQGLWNWRCHLA